MKRYRVGQGGVDKVRKYFFVILKNLTRLSLTGIIIHRLATYIYFIYIYTFAFRLVRHNE